MAEQTCPHCGKHVIVNAEGICTNCREQVAGAKTTINPYQHSGPVSAYALQVEHKRFFAYQASPFPLIAPFVAIFLTSLGNAFGRRDDDSATEMWVLHITAWLLIGLGAILGLVGVVLSYQRRA